MSETEKVARLRTLRGTAFVALFRELDASLGKRLRDEVVARGGQKIRISELGEIAVRENLPLKTLCRMLEEPGVLASGTYEQLLARGVKPTAVLEAGRKRLHILEVPDDAQ